MAHLDLYHRTSPEAAAEISRTKRMTSKENDGSIYFSTSQHGQAEGYGGAVVHVRVPEHLAELDDEFPDGEQHYRVNQRHLQPRHFVGVRRVRPFVAGGQRTAETTDQALDRINRSIWDPIRAEHQSVHRGFGLRLSDEDHAVVHDPSRPMHERATRLMDHLAHHHPEGSGLGVHWTTDSNVAHHFAKVQASHYQKFDEDADGERYGHDGGIPRQRPETRVVLHAHFPEHEHIAHEEEDKDGAFRWDERNLMQHTENGGGYGYEREVPIKRGQPVRVHAISWGLASHRSESEAPHDRETTRYDFSEDMAHKAVRLLNRYMAVAPTKRLFGRTYGLDHRLFDGDQLRPDVTSYVLGTLDGFLRPLYGAGWQRWMRVYLAGSEASEWTSETLEGNNDFDILVGVHYDRARADVRVFRGASDQEITDALNRQFREHLIPRTDPVMITINGQQTGPWSNTWYCNPGSWNIVDIKPYAAYDITNHEWAVRPPHLPDWGIERFPEGHALVEMGEAYEKLIAAIFDLPEPIRTQYGNALWTFLHSDRARAFGPQGEGWWDPGNVMEKWLDQKGVWADLWAIHHRADEDPSTLLAPANWSNDPR